MGNFWSGKETKREREQTPINIDAIIDDLATGMTLPERIRDEFDLSSQCRRRTETGSELCCVYKYTNVKDDVTQVTTIHTANDVITQGWHCYYEYQSAVPVKNEDVVRIMNQPVGTAACDLPSALQEGVPNEVCTLGENGWDIHDTKFTHAMDIDGVQTVVIDGVLAEVDHTRQ